MSLDEAQLPLEALLCHVGGYVRDAEITVRTFPATKKN
jgi:hypothetical protein